MTASLAMPTSVRTMREDSFDPQVPVFVLRWDTASVREQLWDLPEGVCVVGPPPQRFGLKVQRRDLNLYTVKLLWNNTSFAWQSLTRLQLLSTGLSAVLEALGNDLRDLLDQPVRDGRLRANRAA